MGGGDAESIQERNGGAGLEVVEAADFKDEVVPTGAKVAGRNDALTEVGASIGEVGLDALAGEAVGDGGHHLLGHRISGELATIAGDECGVLKFVRAGAEQAVSVDVGGEDDALGIPATGDEDPEVALDGDIHFF